MTTFVIVDSGGVAVSVGTEVADPLTARLAAIPLGDADAVKLRDGVGRWDADTRTVVDVPVPPQTVTPEEKLVQARLVLDQVTALPTPTLTADVVDLLDDLRSVL
jgi:hypothetical protein